MSETIAASKDIFRTGFKEEKDPQNTKDWLLERIIESGCSLPQFSVFDRQYAQRFLNSAGYGDESIDRDNLLVVFRLPAIIERWNLKFFERQENPPVSWGSSYKQMTRLAWSVVNRYSTEMGALDFSRINEKRDHRPNKYHYIWEVGLPK